jgi:hypothetical protein
MEPDTKCLWGIECADNRIAEETRQPARVLLLDSLLVPSHEHMFAYPMDRPD